ncbi:hypothetical protein BGZ74_003364 [Mortierella antarctica]|nr:hypothetical protein BGZ74_003364 [Mortierella antarctica]
MATADYDGRHEDLPDMDAIVLTDENLERRNLYRIALQHLHDAIELQARPNFDRMRCLDYKDAL